jgi:Homeodomain-like domain-containing protein
VLLPVMALARRADLVEVIGAALAAKATGMSLPAIAAMVQRPVDTVRGWLRRFAARAEVVRVAFTVLLVDCGPDPVVPAATGSLLADAVAVIVGAAAALADRWPALGAVSPWLAASAATGGRLLARSWP